jgi:hypothetical protein
MQGSATLAYHDARRLSRTMSRSRPRGVLTVTHHADDLGKPMIGARNPVPEHCCAGLPQGVADHLSNGDDEISNDNLRISAQRGRRPALMSGERYR